MRLALLLCAIVAIRVGGYNFIVGDVKPGSGLLAKHEFIKYFGIPFIKRSKEYSFSQRSKWSITGIKAIDWLYCENIMKIIGGGLGRHWVTLKMESERGKGFKYELFIYVQNDEFFKPFPNITTTTKTTSIKTTPKTTKNTRLITTDKSKYIVISILL